MNIDGNQKEKDAMAAFHRGDSAEGYRLQGEFISVFRAEYREKDHCSCTKSCEYHGNCKECVAIHRAHEDHIPNCFHNMVNSKIKSLSELTEHTMLNKV